jgi:site-specific recombinase XerD
MVSLLNVHFSFLCRAGRSNKNGESPIVFRVIYRDQRRDLYSGLYCNVRDWNALFERVGPKNHQSETINQNLEKIKFNAIQLFDQLKLAGLPFTIDDLVSRLKGNEDRPILLVEYLQGRVKELTKKVGLDITKATLEKYNRSGRFVEQFIHSQLKVKSFPLFKVDAHFLQEYYQYLRSVRIIGNNTAVKYLSFLKTLLMPVIQNGTIRQDPFRQVKFKIKTVSKGFLTDEEIDLLVKVRLGSMDLIRIRDQYLFCCYTGLAYCDLKQLTRIHFIQQREDEFYILKPRQKTGQDSIIPLLPVARRLLQQYSPTNDFRDFRWHVSANQKMNQHLKTIGDAAGLSKTLHMHLARHTFATTVTLSKGVPIESVSSMLGHASLRQTQHYAKIVANKVIKDMSILKDLYK